ncbi:helix-turn-helix domain-containing protein [Novosphingobium sp. FSW06-99]|uniref:helix-turn-helix domain-containing protein n=1 Tax=Novosphingobium sp. FSW06-99 TaxID=1739113 RepID=UPI001E5DF2FE|nr:helix-turn-helix domain-containing protein [Novosphingobium sp. FSW06-99]
MSSATVDLLPEQKNNKKSFLQMVAIQSIKSLPEVKFLFTEHQVANFFGVSVFTVQRLRKNGKIGSCMIAGKAQYTSEHINGYIEKVGTSSCKTNALQSATTGLPNGQAQEPGTQPGTKPKPDKHADVLLAQKIFGKPS